MGTMPDTMQPAPLPSVHQLRVVVRGVSPLIWRRLLIPADTTIADLHAVLQVAFGWTGVRGPTGAKTTSGASRGGLLSSGRARPELSNPPREAPDVVFAPVGPRTPVQPKATCSTACRSAIVVWRGSAGAAR